MGDRVRDRPSGRVLVVEDDQKLVPGQIRVSAGQRQRVETRVPRPDLVHPVLRHQHCRSADEAFRADEGGPQDVCGQVSGGMITHRRERAAERVEAGAVVSSCRVSMPCRASGIDGEPERASRSPTSQGISPSVAEHHRSVSPAQHLVPDQPAVPAQWREEVAKAGAVVGEDPPASRVGERIGPAERCEVGVHGADPQPETGTSKPQTGRSVERHLDEGPSVCPRQPPRGHPKVRGHRLVVQQRGQAQDGLGSAPMTDDVQVVGHQVDTDDPRHGKPRAGVAQRGHAPDPAQAPGPSRGPRTSSATPGLRDGKPDAHRAEGAVSPAVVGQHLAPRRTDPLPRERDSATYSCASGDGSARVSVTEIAVGDGDSGGRSMTSSTRTSRASSRTRSAGRSACSRANSTGPRAMATVPRRASIRPWG